MNRFKNSYASGRENTEKCNVRHRCGLPATKTIPPSLNRASPPSFLEWDGNKMSINAVSNRSFGIAPYDSIQRWRRGHNYPRNLLTKAETLSVAIVETKSNESYPQLLIKDKCYTQRPHKIFSNLNGLISKLTELPLQSLVRSMEKRTLKTL